VTERRTLSCALHQVLLRSVLFFYIKKALYYFPLQAGNDLLPRSTGRERDGVAAAWTSRRCTGTARYRWTTSGSSQPASQNPYGPTSVIMSSWHGAGGRSIERSHGMGQVRPVLSCVSFRSKRGREEKTSRGSGGRDQRSEGRTRSR
jgi:hypothetical protein